MPKQATHLQKSTALKKKAMLAALVKALGNISVACKETGVCRQSHYDWMKLDPEYAKGVGAIDEASIDFAELALMRQIKNDNTTATIFYLKTKGKGRGYIERQELTGKDGQPLNQDITVTLPDEH